VLRYYLALLPAVFVRPAPWSLALRAPAAGTKTFAGCRARIPLRPLARDMTGNKEIFYYFWRGKTKKVTIHNNVKAV